MPPTTKSQVPIEAQIRGTRRQAVLQEWLTNSLHFPLANIILEMLITGLPAYFTELGLYALVAGSLVQAGFLGGWQFAGHPRPWVGNLIGPALYTLIEVGEEGMAFFDDPYHWAYWGFALAIGAIQQARLVVRGQTALLLLENVVRTCILLATYWMLEAIAEPGGITTFGFFIDPVHRFLSIVLVLLGLALGLASAASVRYLDTLRRTAAELKRYSTWLLGAERLARAVEDPAHLTLRRRERTVLFLDIRGFTAWSEARPPEQVVSLLNRCFELAEAEWTRPGTGGVPIFSLIKVKFTGDEIMLVFAEPVPALLVARGLQGALGRFLGGEGLASGIGLHHGPLVEGLLGSPEVKGYDVIGDTVNTAKRICDQAGGGEVLYSAQFAAAAGVSPQGEPITLSLKGKNAPFLVFRDT